MEISTKNETILSIKSVESKEIQNFYSESKWIGFIIITNQRTLNLLITSERQCSEDVGSVIIKEGILMTEDNINDFIGSKIISINVIEKQFDGQRYYANDDNNYENSELYAGDCLFINFETSNGLLQFVLYNDHNGYYGHYASITQSIPTELFSVTL
jgi:hypothetical protein